MKQIELCENGIYAVWQVCDDLRLQLLHFLAQACAAKAEPEEGVYALEVHVTGENCELERNGIRHAMTSAGWRMQYIRHTDERNEAGRRITFYMKEPAIGLQARQIYQFYDGIQTVRAWAELENVGADDLGIEYVSSFALTGVERGGLSAPEDKMRVWIPHNTWCREAQWKSYSFPEVGLTSSQIYQRQHSATALSVGNTGTWSTKSYLPMGYLENVETGSALLWQIENNGSWHWEIGDQTGYYYLLLSGPTESDSHWWKKLKPGEQFVSVPAAVSVINGTFSQAVGEMTKYRRRIRRTHPDNVKASVIFNDYMNCLWADPTTEKEKQMIDAAAELGCEYYVVDGGWYSAGYWWDSVGEWKESKERFPNGLVEVMEYIRGKGMIPGLWLEPEVMGIHSPMVQQVKPEWFFTRHGKAVQERSRYQLDFRNPEVIQYMDETIDRLIKEYGVGYFKIDYNIEAGIGTETDADSFGDGLLSHNRAYLRWLESVMERYPDLVFENCSSGGLRLDYAMLARYPLQSTSDQEDYIYTASIAANAPTAVTPEQAGVWSYPLADSTVEQTAFNMVNAMLMRIHQSGRPDIIAPECFAVIKEGIDCYKQMRGEIPTSLPFWPLGLSALGDEWLSLGMETKTRIFIAVWRCNSSTGTISLPVPQWKGKKVKASCFYPQSLPSKCEWNQQAGSLSAVLPASVSARIFVLEQLDAEDDA